MQALPEGITADSGLFILSVSMMPGIIRTVGFLAMAGRPYFNFLNMALACTTKHRFYPLIRWELSVSCGGRCRPQVNSQA